MSGALRPDDPSGLGPFQLRERLAEHLAGAVFLSYDEYGRAVAIAVPHAAAAADAALRDRFAGAVRELVDQSPEQVLASGLDETPPWAATTYEAGSTPTQALGLLDAAGLTEGDPETGPDFAPHWASTPSTPSMPSTLAPYTPPSVSGSTPASSTSKSLLLVAGLVLLGVVVVGAAGWFTWRTVGDAWFGDSGPSSSSSSDTGGSDTAESVPDGPPGPVAGPTYGEGESTYPMDDLFGFDFRAPDGWGCMGRSDPSPDSTGYTCLDEGGTFPPKENGAGGIVEVTPCPTPCAESEWKRIRENFPDPETPWQRIDDSTLYAQTDVIETENGPMIGLRMSHVYAASGAGPPDQHLTVRLAGKPSDLKAMQKLVNELRSRTP